MKRHIPDTRCLGPELDEEALASVSGGFDFDYPCGNDLLYFRLKGWPGPRPVLNTGALNVGTLPLAR